MNSLGREKGSKMEWNKKFAKSKWSVALWFSMAVGLIGCPHKGSDAVSNTDGTSQFMSEYSDRATANSVPSSQKPFSLRKNGDLYYTYEPSRNCSITMRGHIDSVLLTGNSYYTVSYRNTYVEKYYLYRCSSWDSNCYREVNECRRLVRQAERNLHTSQSIVVQKGQDPRTVQFVP